jgi:hypothetical protein
MANCLPPSSLYPRSAMEDECINGMVGRKIRRSAVGIGFAASSAATFGMPLGTGAMIAVNGKRSRVYRSLLRPLRKKDGG